MIGRMRPRFTGGFVMAERTSVAAQRIFVTPERVSVAAARALVMAGLDPAICAGTGATIDARVRPGHDD